MTTTRPLSSPYVAAFGRHQLPHPLKRSLQLQAGSIFIALGISLRLGDLFAAGLCSGLLLCLLIAVVSFWLRAPATWQGARHGAILGLTGAVIGSTLAVAYSVVWLLVGLTAVVVLADYLRALHHSDTRAYFLVRDRRPGVRQARFFFRKSMGLVVLGVFVTAGTPKVFADDAPETLEECLEKIPDEYAAPRDRVIKTLERYRQTSAKLKASAVNDLDQRLRVAQQQAGPTSHQALAVQATFNWMQFQQAPPKHAAALPWIVSYCERLMRAQTTAWRQLTTLNKLLVKEGHLEEALMLEAAFRRLETPRLLSQNLVSGRTFKGYRTTTNGKKLISILIRLNRGPESPFAGSIERDFMYRGHPVYNIKGQFDGLQVVMQTGSVKSFGNKGDHAWTYTGYLVGRSIVGRFTGHDKKGKRIGGLFHIRSGG